ncbi:hypothetical protein CAPTEDRAFT_131141, partial [Capitella teleta]
KSCKDLRSNGFSQSGIYTIRSPDASGLRVYCDMQTDGGGWLVFQRRKDGSQDFFLNWEEYATGFGNPESEFWLGNRNLHALTSTQTYEMRVDLRDLEGETRFAYYSTFRIGSEAEKFKLTISGYSGTAGDAMEYHNGMGFTTKDQDNDFHVGLNCAVRYSSAWWYKSCYHSNLNGVFLNGAYTGVERGVTWRQWKGVLYSLPFSEMKIRPIG